MRFQRTFVLTIATIAMLAGSALAQTQINLGVSGDKVGFSSNTISLGSCSAGACVLTGSADVKNASGTLPWGSGGTYTFHTTGTLTYGAMDKDGNYPLTGTGTTFTFEGVGGKPWVTADVSWTVMTGAIYNGKFKPSLNGTLSNIHFTTDANGEFQAIFENLNHIDMDFTVNQFSCDGRPCSGSATVSSGQVTPVPNPEPASLALLGSGLLVVGAAVRRRWKK